MEMSQTRSIPELLMHCCADKEDNKPYFLLGTSSLLVVFVHFKEPVLSIKPQISIDFGD